MSYKRRLSLSILLLVGGLVVGLALGGMRFLVGEGLRAVVEQAERAAERTRTATLRVIEEQSRVREFVPSGLEHNRAFFRQMVREDAGLGDALRRELRSSPALAEIAVTEPDGRILAGTTERDWWPTRPALAEVPGQSFLQQWSAVFAPQTDYEATRPMGDAQGTVMVARVAVSTALVRQQLEPQMRTLALAALAGLSAALALAVAFSRVALRPLDALGKAIDRMTRGEFSAQPPAARGGADEYAAISSKLSLLGQQFRDARDGISSLRGNVDHLLGKLDDAILLFDRDEKLVLASAAANRFLGQGRWEMLGRSLEEVFSAEGELGQLVQSAVHLRQPLEERLVGRALLSVELIDDRGRTAVLVLLRDAETRRQISSQVEVSNRLAAINRLTGGVAHEIKNPLNGITLHLVLLKNRLSAGGSAAPPELEVIQREMARLDRVVKTFLDFTRPLELELTEVEAARLLEDVAAMAGAEAAQNGVRLQVRDDSGGARVRADADLLKQALLNLAINGIQSMPGGGELALRAARAGAEVEFSVADQGAGIPAEIRERIFNLYFTTKKNGSGIGLAMAFRAIQLHNGTIDFASELERGTIFRARLPAVEAT